MEVKNLQMIGDNIPVGLISLKLNQSLKIIDANKSFYHMFGYTMEEFALLFNNELIHIIHTNDRDVVRSVYLEQPLSGNEYKIELRIRKKDGDFLLCQMLGNSTVESDGEIYSYTLLIDISDRKNVISDIFLKESLNHEALVNNKEIIQKKRCLDELTGCLDKETTIAIIKEIIENSILTDEHVLIIIDIDDFKVINNSLGFIFGDEILREKGEKLRKIIRNGDIIGRVGGNTFAVFLRNISNFISIKQKVEEITYIFRGSSTFKDEKYNLSSSVGIALFNNKSCSYQDLYTQALKALKYAKAKGKDQYCVFTDEIAATKPEKMKEIVKEKNILLKAFHLLQTAKNIPIVTQQVLEMMGEAFHVSRAYILELSEDGKYYNNSYEWCAEGIKPEIDSLQEIPYENYIYITSLAREDGIFVCNNIREQQGVYYETLKEQGVKSFLQGYVKINDIPQILIGIDDCIEYRNWTEEEIILIIYLSNLLGMFNKQVENINLANKFKKFKYLSEVDQLTGIPTKEKFYLDTRKILNANSDKEFLFTLINVNKFQNINSFFGMEEGDRLLKSIANNLGMYDVDTISTLGRIGGDIFCECQEITKPIDVLLKEKISIIKNTIINYKIDYNLSISVGAFVIDKNDRQIEEMYSKAYMAAKKIKHLKDTAYSIYADEMEAEGINEQLIINDMYPALIEKQFQVYFQPKVLLVKGKVIGAEALVRWQHPTRGLISPAEFIPIFEKNGLIIKIDYFVWETVFAFLKKQKESNGLMIPISVNVSRVDLFNKNLIECFKEFLEKYEVDPKYIHIEITESAYSENYEAIIDIVSKLKELGFDIEMDDFGTGYSSLNMFSEMVVDTLKLDMNFIKNLHKSGDKHNILNFIISLAKHFGLPVVAEGIETEEQLKFLKEIGCDIGQGYYFAKPMPEEEFLIYLEENQMIQSHMELIDDIQLVELSDILYPDQKLSNFFNHALTATAILELKEGKFEIVRCNEEYYNELGIKDKNLLFKDKLREIFHKDNLQEMKDNVQRAKLTKKVVSCDIRFLKDSEEHSLGIPQYISIHTRIKLINSSNKSDVFMVTIENMCKEDF